MCVSNVTFSFPVRCRELKHRLYCLAPEKFGIKLLGTEKPRKPTLSVSSTLLETSLHVAGNINV